MKKITEIIFFIMLLMSVEILNVGALTSEGDSAEVPYTTHNYIICDNAQAVSSKALYKTETVLTPKRLGINSIEGLNDVSTDKNGNILLLDGAGSKIIIIDSRFRLIKEINTLKLNGKDTFFKGACGIFAYEDTVYIADTENARILIIDYDGNVEKEVVLPESKLIPKDFNYRPIKISVDSSGYLYVLSDGSYYGAILYSTDYNFLGFYGANTVPNSVTQVIRKLWKKITTTDAKRASSASKIPYQFTDLYVDSSDFIYTATGKVPGSNQLGQIKRLSPGGKNILDSDNVTFGDLEVTTINGSMLNQNIEGIAVDKDGFIYCYDVSYGRIYVYDQECYMMAAFGGGLGAGEQDGTFKQISAIDVTYDGNRIFAVDSLQKSVTVFSVSDYGRKFKNARTMTLNGDYEESVSLWKDVLSADRNCQLANIGLAKSAISSKNYSEALKYAKDGWDKEVYSQAFTYVRKSFFMNNINVLSFISIFIVAVVIAVLIIIKKKKILLIRNKNMSFMLATPLHPVANFGEIKSEKSDSVVIGIGIMIVFYISAIIKSTSSGFIFRESGSNNFNSLLVLLQTVGFVLLWTITNWAVATLMGGIGNIRKIFIVITYSIVPMIASNFIYTLLSHILNETEGTFLSVIYVASILYSIFMVIIGSIIVHDISFKKFLAITFVTLLGIMIAIFLLVLIFILMQQTVAFFGTLLRELVFR